MRNGINRWWLTYSELPRVLPKPIFIPALYDFRKSRSVLLNNSMPTKAPEYMVSGTPIIVFGPGETALVDDAVQNKWAVTVTENNTKLLADAVASGNKRH